MGRGADERIGPVASAQGHLFAGGELQTSVRAEVEDCVGAEPVACPEVRGDVEVRGRGVGSVDDGEVVVARAGCRLGQQHDVAQFHAGQRQTALAVVHLSAREGSVERLGFGDQPQGVQGASAIIPGRSASAVQAA